MKGKIMSELKKCPFNNFNPCIGTECAFFLEPISEKAMLLDEDIILDPKDISFPCSLTVIGKVAFLNKIKPKEVDQ